MEEILDNSALKIFKKIKVLEVNDNYFIAAKGYSLIKFDIKTNKIESYAKVIDSKYGWLSKLAITRRLLRAEITGLYSLDNKSQLLIAKKGIFLKEKDSVFFTKVFAVSLGSKPLNLCIMPSGNIYFGEYFANIQKNAVKIYCSKNNGNTWTVAYTFSSGNINHIHGLFFDKYTLRMWVCTGDRENECIIGYTEDEFTTFVEVFRGDQEYRTCHLFFYEKYIVFPTDSQYTQNEIKVFDRDSLRLTTLQNIQGTAIKGGQVDNVCFISTTVEPSAVNMDMYSHLWVTKDGLYWSEVYKAQKDYLPFIFQFGSIEFPQHKVKKPFEKLFFSGRALKRIDGCSLAIDI